MKSVMITMVLGVLALVGCDRGGADVGTSLTGQDAAAPASPDGGLSGTVTETMNSGGYTYLKIKAGSQEVWAAGPQTALKVGDTVALPKGSPMKGYTSKTLNRTFDSIYFVGAINVGGAAPAGGAAAAAPQAGNPHAGMPGAGAQPSASLDGITKADKTVGEIWTDKKSLGGKTLKVRGRVVKYNGGILGKNWLHLRDGSGADGTNDLTVTTDAEAKVGDLVVAEGKVVLDKDFGAGYRYEVILEDAKVAVE